MPESPLQGVTVLDLSRVVAGPFAAQMLADLGARVIKLERTDGGDDLRKVGPPWCRQQGEAPRVSTYFAAVNRGKQSVPVDFDAADGIALVRQLVTEADVVIENFRTGTLARKGLGYDDLAAINPRLILCSVTGFGQTGPRATESGYDYLAQAMAGVMHVTGHVAGEPGAGPMRVGVPIVDIAAAKDAVIGILAALRQREKTGRGQHVDVSLFDSAMGLMLNPASAALNAGEDIGPSGNIHPSAFPYGVFPAADGDILIATFTDAGFAGIATVLGHPEWPADPRFDSPAQRVANRQALESLMVAELAKGTRAHWIAAFNAAKVSCGPINTVAEALQDPQVAARKLVVTTQHPTLGTVRGVRLTVTTAEASPPATLPPPTLGEHATLLRQAG